MGYFLTEAHIRSAIELLAIQIQSNSHNHRCLGLEILRRENALGNIEPEEFYNNYIRNDLCFNYPSLFRVTPYYVPKGDGGVRQFHFLEAPLRILYYALGFYFLELTREIRTQLATIHRNSSIYTYYGANIRLDKPCRSQIYYQEDYQEFTRNIRRTVRRQAQEYKVAVLHIDIQDFFRSIAHSKLVQVLANQSIPESQLRLRYDERTKLTVRDILFLIMHRHEGLPLSQQNIVSNLLSHLFLYPLDNFLREIQIENQPSLTFHRYVDDMFITVRFPLTDTNESIGTTMLDISTNIGAFLSSNLDLCLNPLKTRLDIIESEDEVNELIERSRLVSFYQPLPEEGGESPQNTLNRAITVLNRMKKKFRECGFVKNIATNDDLALKQCFQCAVIHYTRSEQAQRQLESVFRDWYPALMPKSIRVLVFLISRVPDALSNLLNHVRENLSNSSPSLTTVHLTEHLMLIEEYDHELDDIVAQHSSISSNPYITLIGRLVNPSFPISNCYIQIHDECLRTNATLMKQVRCAVIAEKLSIYSLAYNHLLNVLQEWCYCNQTPDINRSNYNRNHVIEWLTPFAINSELMFVITMFDRRNRNTISHPGDENIEVSPVDRTEYENHLATLNQYLPNFSRRYLQCSNFGND